MNDKQINKYIDFILNKSKNPKKDIQYLIYLISDTEYFDDTTLILGAEAEIEIIAQTTDASGIPVTICLTMEPIQ